MAIKLIVGLGNPGPQYKDTRHNAGFWFISKLCDHYHTQLQLESKFKSLVTQIDVGSHTCKIAIPTTYMNLSGDAVSALSKFYNIQPQEILIAHDELDLPVGTLRLKLEGGHGGHNGLRDIFAKLGTRSFYRLRIGISHPGHKDDVVNYVLHKPPIEEGKKIMHSLESAVDILPCLFKGEFEHAMKELHTS